MRFRSMHMPAFGPFTDFEMDFGAPGLQVVFGPNESGKSSSLRAFRALLYGMHRQTTDAFLHPYPKLAIRARLEHSDGSVLDLVRRKGRKDTLKTHEGESIEEAHLTRFIGNLTEEVFDRLYGLDHRTLASGGIALLAEGGRVGESLFAANVGPEFRKVREELRKEAEELWRPKGKNPAINATLGAWKDAVKQTKEATLQVSKFESLQQELEEQESLAGRVREDLAATRARLENLGNQKKALQSWARFKELQLELEELAEIPDLDEDFSRRREKAHDEFKQAMAELGRLKAERTQLDQKLQEVPETWPVLEAPDAIENLFRRASRVEDLLTDIPVLEAELRHLESQVQKTRLDLGLSEESDHFPNSSIRAEAGQLASEHLDLSRRRTAVEESLTKLKARLARLESQKQ
ncbi:MAG: AAA family ATPase, partial [Candidatus Eremiobacteraeota bacterium]|nr:AAA family ATPase [Candidatus Eremiobacteraeota bacterium]